MSLSDHIRQLISNGSFARAFDEASEGVRTNSDNLEYRYLAILALARAGARAHALELFQKYGLEQAKSSNASLAVEITAIGAKLHKDQGLANEKGRAERHSHFKQAYEAYATEFKRNKTSHNGINAASLAFWLGNDEFGAIAQQVLAIDGEGYFGAVSAMEAHLLLGQTERAVNAVKQALKLNPAADERATTMTQLDAHREYGLPTEELLNLLQVGPVIRVLGNMPEGSLSQSAMTKACDAAAEHIAALKPSFVFGSLAAGADLAVAERLLDSDVPFRSILPCELNHFRDYSVTPYGDFWVSKFEKVLENSKDISFAFSRNCKPDKAMLRATSRLTMGSTLMQAEATRTKAFQVAVIGAGNNSTNPGSTMEDLSIWQRAGQDNIIFGGGNADFSLVEAPLNECALLFADVKGYSSLDTMQLKHVHTILFPAIAKLLDSSSNVKYSNTWGDGIFFAVDSALEAAGLSLQLNALVADYSTTESIGGLRVGLHYGATEMYDDPISQRMNLYGPEVTHAARIEPVSIPGLAHASHHYAARLVLEMASCDKHEFKMEYAGKIELAKRAGLSKLFRLESI